MSDEPTFFNKMVTKGLEPIESDGRFFEGFLTVQVKDKQGEVTIVDELYKVLPIWMDRGAPITDTHSNRVVGKGINFARSDYTDSDGTIYPAIKVTGKIYNDYELDNEIWKKIKSGEYKGLSFGGSTKTDRQPMRMKDGSIAYSLSKLEHYEVAVCKDPAVPLAVITDTNPIAKSNMNCDSTGCYVTKPILGAPNFEAATRKVMEESNVPKENAKRIVGAAEHGKLRKGDPNLPYNEKYFEKEICDKCGKVKKMLNYSDEEIVEVDGKTTKRKKKKIKKGEECEYCNAEVRGDAMIWEGADHDKHVKDHIDPKTNRLRSDISNRIMFNDAKARQGKLDPDWLKSLKNPKKIKKGKQVKSKKKKKKQAQGIGNKRSWRTFKSIVDTNKILGKFQGNAISLARILDKDAPKDIAQPHQTGNVPKKQPKEPKGQSHAAQSTNARLGFDTGDISPSEGWYRDSQGGQPDISGRDESAMNYVNPDSFDRDLKYIKPSYRNPRGDPRKRKAWAKIQAKIKDAIRETHVTTNEPKQEKQTYGQQARRARVGEGYNDDSFHSDTPSKKLSRGKAPTKSPERSFIESEDPTHIGAADRKESKIKIPKGGRAPKIASALMAWALYNKIKGIRGTKNYGGKWHFALPSTSGKKKDKPRKGTKGGNEKKNRKLMETMSPEVKLNYQRNMEAMAAAGKDKKSKKKVKKVGSSLPESGIDPNQANQGAGFAIRNQKPPKRKMEAKLGDGTYDYSS